MYLFMWLCMCTLLWIEEENSDSQDFTRKQGGGIDIEKLSANN